MGTRQIRVSEALYARINTEKRDDETIGEALERMVNSYGLTEFAGDVEDASDAWNTGSLEEDFEADDRENRAELEEELP